MKGRGLWTTIVAGPGARGNSAQARAERGATFFFFELEGRDLEELGSHSGVEKQVVSNKYCFLTRQ